MISALLKWVGDFFAGLIAQFVRDKRADSNAQDLGASKAENETRQVITEISDAQAANNAAPRSNAKSVADRLRDEARGTSSSIAGTDQAGNRPGVSDPNKLDS